MLRRMGRAVTRLVAMKAEVARVKEKVFQMEKGIKDAYLEEVELKEGRERWNFVGEFNQLLSGETNKIAPLGAIQKDLVDCWEEEDFESMGVTKEKALEELEYEGVLVPLEIQYTNIEKRKQKSREKIERSWGSDWMTLLGRMNPDWESEHYLQHLSVLATEFPSQKEVVPFLGNTVDHRKFQLRTKKGETLTPQDVKLTLAELTRYRDMKGEEEKRKREMRLKEKEKEREEMGEEEEEGESEEQREDEEEDQ